MARLTKAQLEQRLAEMEARVAHLEARDRLSVRQPSHLAAHLLQNKFHEREQEHMVVVCLNARCQITATKVVAQGTLARVDVHPRDVFRPAIRMNAYAIALCHNHPSGDTTPSESDIKLTTKMMEAGNLLGISVVDHIIVGGAGDWTSMAEIGLM